MPRQTKYDFDVKEIYAMYVEDGMSTVQIAKYFNLKMPSGAWNAPVIQRFLDRHNIPQRSKSEAQKIALETGTATHPTEGKPRTMEERLKIGVALSQNYKTASPASKERRLRGVKEFWSNKDNKEAQEEAIRKRGAQIRKTIVEGTMLEKTLATNLIRWGYSVDMHNSEVFGQYLEADMIVKGQGITVVLEVDGPRHWGKFIDNDAAKLAEIIRTDNKKNAMVLAMKNVFMLRILWPFGSKTVQLRATLEKVHQVLEHFKKLSSTGNLRPQDRFVALDMKLVLTGKKCTDNPFFRDAMKILNRKK